MKQVAYRFVLIALFFTGFYSSTYSQVDTLTKHVASNLFPVFFEIEFLIGKDIQHDHLGGLGVNLVLGYQKAFSDNKAFSLYTGLDGNIDIGFALNVGGRLSYFTQYAESYAQSGLLFSPGKNGLGKFAGYNIAIGQKYHDVGVGFFLAYDNYLTTRSIPQERYIRLGLTTFKKTALWGVAGIGGLVVLVTYLIIQSR